MIFGNNVYYTQPFIGISTFFKVSPCVMELKVGMFIEETDIADLEAWIASTTYRYIKKVYSNLLGGSYNHLDAFCSNLEKLGVTCEPYELPPEP